MRTILLTTAAVAAMALALAPLPAAAADESVPAATTLGGLPLGPLPPPDGSLPLSAVSAPPLMLSLQAPEDARLPLATGSLTPVHPGGAPGLADDETRTLGTRLTLGQPLGFDALGGAVDWQAAATVEPGPQGEAYGLSLSIGSIAGGGPLPPSDLRMGLTYGTAPDTGEQGVVLDFSYRF
ncbi:hypothetical protein [Caenispirillum bisanense]|nr:hypothetical protein [Caenispirillum bisanense]